MKKSIEEYCINEEVSSFKFYCKQLGVSEDVLLNGLVESLKEFLDEDVAFYKKTLKHDEVEDHFPEGTFEIHKIKEPSDFFNYHKKKESYFLISVKEIVHLASGIYAIHGLFSQIFFTKYPKPDSLKYFLDNIYSINIFSNSLDPETYKESFSEDQFIIRNSFLYDSILTHSIIPLIINFSTYLEFGKDSRKSTSSNIDRKKVSDIILSLASLLNNSTHFHNDLYQILSTNQEVFQIDTTQNMFLGRELYHGLKFFSYFHEYSHIIYDHFIEEKSNFIIELEADAFAINALLLHTSKQYNGQTNVLFQVLFGLKMISPLIYFLFKIAQEESLREGSSSYIFRWEYAKMLIHKHLENVDLLEKMHDLISDLEVMFFHIVLTKVNSIENISEIILKDAKIAEDEKLTYPICYKDGTVNLNSFSFEIFSDYWSEYFTSMKEFLEE